MHFEFYLIDDNTWQSNNHQHESLQPKECYIMLISLKIDGLIKEDQTTSVKNIYDPK